MLKTTKRYVITTNAVNSYKFRLLSLGLIWKLYFNNPIMLYMHYRATGQNRNEVKPLGSVREIEYDEATGEYSGRLYFNPKDPFAVDVYEMYENETMNMLSIGVEVVEISEDPELMEPGQLYGTITKAIVKEISCVDIGANSEAFGVALYDASGKMITLSDSNSLQKFFTPKINNSDNMKITTLSAPAILVLLKLSDTATEAEAVQKITELVTLADSQAQKLITLSDEKTKAENELEDLKKTSKADQITALVDGAFNARKITAAQKPQFTKLATGDFEGTKAVLDSMVGSETIQKNLGDGTETDPELTKLCAQTYDEAFRSNTLPTIKLKAPEEFKRIYKTKFGREPKD